MGQTQSLLQNQYFHCSNPFNEHDNSLVSNGPTISPFSFMEWTQTFHWTPIRFIPIWISERNNKLSQNSFVHDYYIECSVHDYYIEFVALANRTNIEPPKALRDCFISGLRLDIRRDAKAQCPPSLFQPVTLARLLWR